jgi:hypothetical protein
VLTTDSVTLPACAGDNPDSVTVPSRGRINDLASPSLADDLHCLWAGSAPGQEGTAYVEGGPW